MLYILCSHIEVLSKHKPKLKWDEEAMEHKVEYKYVARPISQQLVAYQFAKKLSKATAISSFEIPHHKIFLGNNFNSFPMQGPGQWVALHPEAIMYILNW